jgi:hypothetical protein
MNLQEQIYRIQGMMGVINENIPRKIIRRLNTLDKYVKSSYTWLNPGAFKNFEEFVDRVVFSTTRDFVGDALLEDDDNLNYDELLKIREEIKDYINKKIIDDYLLEIEMYYFGNK